jgi:hypothetical protein
MHYQILEDQPWCWYEYIGAGTLESGWGKETHRSFRLSAAMNYIRELFKFYGFRCRRMGSEFCVEASHFDDGHVPHGLDDISSGIIRQCTDTPYEGAAVFVQETVLAVGVERHLMQLGSIAGIHTFHQRSLQIGTDGTEASGCQLE